MLIIGALISIAQIGVEPALTPTVEDEVTVIGRRLGGWRGSLKTRNGVARCVTRRSTGDRDIDRIGCDAMITCLPRFESEFKAVLAGRHDEDMRDRMNVDINRRLTACVEDRHDQLVAALAERRAESRR